jgi:hypothetical protein
MVVYLTPPIKTERTIQLKVIPIVDRLDPLIDNVIFRMLRHPLRLATDVRPNLGIAKLPSRARQSAIRPR